jgi:hydroxyacylglutathione hydrolase
MIHIEPIPAFNDNYIWCIYDDDSSKAAVVDPGEAGPVEEALLAQQL